MLSSCSAKTALSKSEIITTDAHQTWWNYTYDPKDLGTIEIQWDLFKTNLLSEWTYLNTSRPNTFIDDFSIWNWYNTTPGLRWKYSFSNKIGPIEVQETPNLELEDTITEFPVPSFDTEMKMLRRDISEILDFDIVGCSEWLILKWEEEAELRFPLTCEFSPSERQTGFTTPERGYYTVIEDGRKIKKPLSDCKIAPRIKTPPHHDIEIFNQDWLQIINNWEQFALREAYIKTCITEKRNTMRR